MSGKTPRRKLTETALKGESRGNSLERRTIVGKVKFEETVKMEEGKESLLKMVLPEAQGKI